MRRLLLLVLILASAAAVASQDGLHRVMVALRSLAEPLFGHGEAVAPHFDKFYAGMVESLPPQQRAERALELAINNYQGASDYVVEQAHTWRKQIKQTAQLDALVRTALNSRRIETRMAAFEANLAEYNYEATPAQVDSLIAARADDPKKNGPWTLWLMSLIGARGVDRERVFGVLNDALRDTDVTQRHWAVDGLARFGGEEVIPLLLGVAEHDPSVEVQERAFCGLAMSGTLQLAERYQAVPGLLGIAENPNTTKQQHAWAFQALREITETYDVPEDTAAWRQALDRAGLLQQGAAIAR